MNIDMENDLIDEIQYSINNNQDNENIHIWPVKTIAEMNNYNDYFLNKTAGDENKINNAVPGLMYELIYGEYVMYSYERYGFFLTLTDNKYPILLSDNDMKRSNEWHLDKNVYYKMHKRIFELVDAGLTYDDAFSAFKV